MKVFRIEDVYGAGMYRLSWPNLNFHDIAGNDPATHLNPMDDCSLMDEVNAKGMRVGDTIFGFASVDQLRRWVFKDEWMVELKYNNWRLSIFEVPDHYVAVGATQCIMMEWYALQERRAGRVEHHDLCEFFNIKESEHA